MNFNFNFMKEGNCHSNKYNIWTLAPKGAKHQGELAD
jgi:hypothetical protein